MMMIYEVVCVVGVLISMVLYVFSGKCLVLEKIWQCIEGVVREFGYEFDVGVWMLVG